MQRLVLGIGLVSVLVGFMVGASSSPVVSAVIPAFFALVVTTLAVFVPAEGLKELEIPGVDATQRLTRAREALENQWKNVPAILGTILIVFSLAYASGAYLGIGVRLGNMLWPTVNFGSVASRTSSEVTQAREYMARKLTRITEERCPDDDLSSCRLREIRLNVEALSGGGARPEPIFNAPASQPPP